jgi:hypothetical protein
LALSEAFHENMSLFGGCIAATIEVEILFACFEAKRLEWIACVPPKIFSLHF